MIINLLLTSILTVLFILMFLQAHKEFKLSRIRPIDFEILEMFDKDKKTIVKDSRDAYYVNIDIDGVITTIRLREQLSENQKSIKVHINSKKEYLAYKESRKCYSKEFNLAMLHDASRITIFTILCIITLTIDLGINCYDTYSKYAIDTIHNTEVFVEDTKDVESSIMEDKNLKFKTMYTIAKIMIEILEPIDIEHVGDCQLAMIVADSTLSLLTGEKHYNELPLSHRPIRYVLMEDLHDYYTDLSLIYNDSMNGGENEESIQKLNDGYTYLFYFGFAYFALYYTFKVLFIVCIIYKIIMKIVFNVKVNKFRKLNNIS